MPETLFTVWVNLFERGFAADGDTVLVHGGTSGIGTMAIALGQLFGLKVIVTCGSDEKCAAAPGARRGRGDQLPHAGLRRGGQADHRRRGRRGRARHGRRRLSSRATSHASAEEGRHVSIAVQRGATAEIPIVDIMRRRLT